MILKSFGKIIKKTVGILLPVFLFFTSIPTPVLALVDRAEENISITFQIEPSNYQSIVRNYALSDSGSVFVNTTDPILSQYFFGKILPQNYSVFKNDPLVISTQIDQLVSASLIPDDPYFTLDDKDDSKQWYLPKISMPKAWDDGTGRSNVVIAVIDTGIHASHVEFNRDQVIAGYDTIKDNPILAGADSDDNGHGTAVSGIIGATADNGRGIAGIHWKARIMPIKALRADGKGVVSSVARGIVWATDHGANIINLSLGGAGFGADESLNAAVRYAFNRDVLIVAAAGNDLAAQGSNLDTDPIYPICADNGKNMIIGVAASDTEDKKAEFSNFGINCVDITAPGKKILTTAYLPADPSDRVMIYGSGTSLATPIVSGVAALMKSKQSSLTNVQMRNILLGTADNIDALNPTNCLGTSCSGFLGKGRINARYALDPQPILNGSLIQKSNNGKIYLIESRKKRYVSEFVLKQRGYNIGDVRAEVSDQLSELPTGDPIPPLEGTLFKSTANATVYVIAQGLRRPVSAPVFAARKYQDSSIVVLPASEISDYNNGDWYWPPDGTSVIVSGNPTVYVMDQEFARPVTSFVFKQRGYSFSRVIKISSNEFDHLPKAPDKFWLPPLDGTIVKASNDPTVYLIRNRIKQAITSNIVFNRMQLRYSNLKVLPPAEIEIIATGDPLL